MVALNSARLFVSCILYLIVSISCMSVGARTQEPSDTIQFSFGRVMLNQPLELRIEFKNPTSLPLKVKSIQLTPPLLARDITKQIEPNGNGSFTLVMGAERRKPGEFEGAAVVNFAGSGAEPLFHCYRSDRPFFRGINIPGIDR